MTIFLIILLSVLSGILYRFGGWGEEGRLKYKNLPAWAFDTKARDIGCAGCCFLGMVLVRDYAWYIHLLSFLLLFGALTTYWDFINGDDNFFIHGLFCGLAYIPYSVASGDFLTYGIRAAALGLLMGLWSLFNGKDFLEEFGRGFFLVITLLLLLNFS